MCPDGSALITRALDGEVLSPADTVRVSAAYHPFRADHRQVELPAGLSLAEILEQVQPRPELRARARVFLGGDEIPAALWRLVRPKAGTEVYIRVLPAGGGGNGGKSALGIVLSIAVIAASIVLAPEIAPFLASSLGVSTATATLIGGALISIVGNLAIMAITGPPKQNSNTQDPLQSGLVQPALSITGSSNKTNPYGVVPRVFGRIKVFPILAGVPFSETVGNDQYLRLLFDFGYGPLSLGDHRIGTTPIQDFDGIEMEIRPGYPTDAPITLYANQVHEDPYSILVTHSGGAVIRQSRPNANEIQVDVGFNALTTFDDNGNPGGASVIVAVDYRIAGSGSSFTPMPSAAVTPSTAGVSNGPITAGAHSVDFTTNQVTAGGVTISNLPVWTDPDTGNGAQLNFYANGVLVSQAVAPTLPGSGSSVFVPATFGQAVTITIQYPQKSNPADGLMPVDEYNGQQPNFRFDYQTTTAGEDTISAASTTQVRRTYRLIVATPAQYEVRVTRVTDDSASTRTEDLTFLTAIRSITYGSPINVTGHCLVAMRIKATNQLNGIVQNYSAIANSVLPTYDGSGTLLGTTGASSPAWAALEVLMGAANKNPVPAGRINFQAFADFAAFCAALDPLQGNQPTFQYDGVIDQKSSVWETANSILAVGRGALRYDNGWGPVWDAPQSAIVQHFSPRNSWGFKSTKLFLDQPHALRVQYVEPDRDWQQSEIIAYADGYSAANATLFEALQLKGVIRASQAWKMGRFNLALAKLRPEAYELNADVEHLVCKRGSLVRVAHDVPRWGLGQWRIKSVVSAGSPAAVTSIALDEQLTMDAAKTYAVRIRCKDGSSIYAPIATVAGINTTVTPSQPIVATVLPDVDDLVMFGETALESVLLLVQSINRGADNTAKLTLLDYSPAVYAADAGPLPPFDTQQTFPSPVAYNEPPQPSVTSVLTDNSVLIVHADGTQIPQIVVNFRLPPAVTVMADAVQTQYRVTGSGSDWTNVQDVLPSAGNVAIQNVVQGQTYDLRIRSLAINSRFPGATSAWLEIDNVTVTGGVQLPADVPSARLNGSVLTWIYDNPPADLKGFQVLAKFGGSADPAGAQNVTPGGYTTDTFLDVGQINGTMSFFIYAVDRKDRLSADPAIVLADLGDPAIDNLYLTEDLKAEGFTGTKTNGTVSGGNLVASSNTLFWNADDQLFWDPVDADAFWGISTYDQMTYQFSKTVPFGDLPANVFFNLTVQAQNWTLEYREYGQGPFWAAPDGALFWDATATDDFWSFGVSDWLPWPGRLLDVGCEQYDFRLITAAGQVQGVVSELNFNIDVDDITETLSAIAIGSSGTRLPVVNTYRQIIDVNLDLNFDGGNAVAAQIVDRLATGPLIKCFTGASPPVATTGNVNARIRGF